MKDPETEFIEALGLAKEQLAELPDFMARTYKGEDKVRIAFRSTIEPSIHFGEWTVVTLSRQEFIHMTNILTRIRSDQK